jgi:hypothetical protein
MRIQISLCREILFIIMIIIIRMRHLSLFTDQTVQFTCRSTANVFILYLTVFQEIITYVESAQLATIVTPTRVCVHPAR